MLMPTFFILETNLYGSIQDIPLPENGRLAYKISMKEMKDTLPFYQNLFTQKRKGRFCLLIEWGEGPYSVEELESLIDYAISFTFDRHYLQNIVNIPFFIFNGPRQPSFDYIFTFREKFRLQGYDDIEYVHMDAGQLISSSDAAGAWIDWDAESVTDPGNITTVYQRIIKNNGGREVSLLASVSSPGQFGDLAEKLGLAENELLRDAPEVYLLWREKIRLERQNRELRSEIGILTEKVASQDSYYSFYNRPESGYKKQVTEIVDFYNTEYEVLPMWYKRFGHILKVILGKRSFRSLFNDNVKKYKN